VSDEFDPLRRLRPDRVRPDDPGDPAVMAREKERLMSIIDQTTESADTTLSLPSIYPRLGYTDERAALAYLTRVFGLTEIREARMEHDDHMLAWLRIGDGVVMIGHTNHDIHQLYSPTELGRSTVMVMVQVPNVDDHYARTVAEGAEITQDLGDAFYGHRRYETHDLEGHMWHFWETFDSIRARGGKVADDV
jgi:uncharacterized glyoxalase superfamily protein PhnB